MKDFTYEVLIIMPSMDDYEAMLPAARSTFKSVSDTILKYVKSIGVSPFCFTNDELALHLNLDVKYVEAFLKEDKLFAAREIEGMDSIPEAIESAEQVEKDIRKEMPAKRGMSDDDRFSLVVKRCKALTRYWIERFKWVITFETLTKEFYRVRTGNAGDERVIWRIKKEYYRVESYMSGQPIDIEFLIDSAEARKPIYTWNMEEFNK